MNSFALIPARRGSKSVRDKNIRNVGGKPLLVWSIEHALATNGIDRIIVSTDCPEYAQIAREHGAETPFLRPAEFSGDRSTDLEVFTHALTWLGENENYFPDLCVHLRPTHPVRDPKDIDAMLRLLEGDPELDSVRSVSLSPETPFKMWYRGEDSILRPVVESDIAEAYNQPRQSLPVTYLQNASIDIARTSTILEKCSMNGDRIFGYVTEEIFDIDDEVQLQRASRKLNWSDILENEDSKRRRFVVDIDGVIASLVESLDYSLAGPRENIIEIINTLYDLGHYIILFTARGSMTGDNWEELTARQMREWGVKYHELSFGKPAGDYYIDDKALPVELLPELAKK